MRIHSFFSLALTALGLVNPVVSTTTKTVTSVVTAVDIITSTTILTVQTSTFTSSTTQTQTATVTKTSTIKTTSTLLSTITIPTYVTTSTSTATKTKTSVITSFETLVEFVTSVIMSTSTKTATQTATATITTTTTTTTGVPAACTDDSNATSESSSSPTTSTSFPTSTSPSWTYIGCQSVFTHYDDSGNLVTPGIHVFSIPECEAYYPTYQYIGLATYPCTTCDPPYNDTYCYASAVNYGNINDDPTGCDIGCRVGDGTICGGYESDTGFIFSVYQQTENTTSIN